LPSCVLARCPCTHVPNLDDVYVSEVVVWRVVY